MSRKSKVLVVEGIEISQTLLKTLRGTLAKEGIVQWLKSKNRILLRRTPLDYLKEGRQEEVLEAARAYADGTYV